MVMTIYMSGGTEKELIATSAYLPYDADKPPCY
jgi:hypothetical protein